MNELTGGSAFPVVDDYGTSRGMTLRDYFAAKAMQTLILIYAKKDMAYEVHTISEDAYAFAEAMIKERNS